MRVLVCARLMSSLVFGTDGWRDVIADGFTVARVRRAARAYAQHLLEDGGGLVLVAHDTRFGGPMFQAAVAATMSEMGLKVRVHDGPLPTPLLSFAVRELGAVGGVMLTASHNPGRYHGFKLKGAYGGTARGSTYEAVAARAAALPDEHDAPPTLGGFPTFDVRREYFAHLGSLLDLDALRGWRAWIVHDAMHGASAGWLEGFAYWAGLPWHIETLRGERDVTFGGIAPEPMPSALQGLRLRLASADGLRSLGIATDGDGDRLAVVAAAAPPLTAHALMALLLDHLDRRGTPGKVAKTVTVSRLVERLARSRGRAVVETPVGFKHLVELLLEDDVMLAGEESGGFGFRDHVPERDGVLTALMVAEALAVGRRPLDERLSELEEETGWRHAYDRDDLSVPGAEVVDAVMRHLETAPRELAGFEVTGVERRDGVKLNLGEERWLMFRASGTEPVLRLYAEGPDDVAVEELLDAARALVASFS